MGEWRTGTDVGRGKGFLKEVEEVLLIGLANVNVLEISEQF